MSTFAEVFREWADFPKGLQVLVVDRDTQFLQDITHKLEVHQFFVTSFSSEEEACRELESYTQIFHVALMEANESDGLDSCKILSFAKDVPTIMTSRMENVSLMVKLIALGAVEFLVKPLSDEKIRNIWQHVIRKALDSSWETLRPGYLQPGKPRLSTSTVMDGEHQACSRHEAAGSQPECVEKNHCNGMGVCHTSRHFIACDRLAAPSTPQLEQGVRTALQESAIDDSPRSHDFTEVCNYKESITQIAPVFSLARSANVKEEARELPNISEGTLADRNEEKTANKQAQMYSCAVPMLKSVLHVETVSSLQKEEGKVAVNEENEDKELLTNAVHCEGKTMMEACLMSSTDDYEPQEDRSSTISQPVISKDTAECLHAESTCQSGTPRPCQEKGESKTENRVNHAKGGKDNKRTKKKLKVDWTADLHRRFVQAVEYLGVDQAIPSRILEVMKVEGLTRHNVASHLQKYRSHKKHLQARELEASKHQSKLNCTRPWSSAGQSANQMWMQPCPPLICAPLHVWGHPKVDHSASMPMAQYMAGASVWPAFDTFAWKPAMADSWAPGLPSIALCYGPHTTFFATSGHAQKEGSWRSFLEDADDDDSADVKSRFKNSDGQDFHTPNQLLDSAINEALNNPWMPLPLGLKPPSMDSVMTELERQGITTLSALR